MVIQTQYGLCNNVDLGHMKPYLGGLDDEVRDYYDELNVYVRYVIKKTEKEN